MVYIKKDEQNVDTQLIGPFAEIAFYELENKEFVLGTQINFVDGSGKMRNELWKTDANLIFYFISNQGFRQLNFLPLENLPKARVDLIELKAQYEGQEFIPYESIEERERI